MSDLDQHLAGIDELLAGNTRPIFDENNPKARLPAPPDSAVRYNPPPGTYDGAMAREVRGTGDNMPNFAKPAPAAQAPLAILGGRGMAKMMDSSPPIRPLQYAQELHVGAGGMTPEDQTGESTTLRDNGGTSWNSPATPGVAGEPAQQGGDMISLLRNLFQGAL